MRALMICAFLLLCSSVASAQQPYNPYRPYRAPVYYYPVVTWYTTGTSMNVGPVQFGPNNRYVNFGVNVGFNRYSNYNSPNWNTRYRQYGTRQGFRY